jgi:hypothetical protein
MRASIRGRLALVVTAAWLVSGLTPGRASAESALWTLTASPLAVSTGVASTFSLRGTNEDPLAAFLSSNEIGCIRVDVPSNFSVAGVAVTGASTGNTWIATQAGNRVTVRTTSGGDRLATLDWVKFTVGATALSAGSLAWSARAFRQQDCSGTGALLGVPPVVVVTGAAVTPTPVPTPVPTPTPTLAPTPTPSLPLPTPSLPLPTPSLPLPTPSLPLPSSPLPTPTLPLPTLPLLTPTPSLPILPLPTPSPTPVPWPTVPLPPIGLPGSPSPTPSGDPTSSTSPSASLSSDPSGTPSPVGPEPGGGAGTTSGSGASPSGPSSGGLDGAPRQVRLQAPETGIGLSTLGVLTGLDTWIVPAAVIAGPGLIVLLWIALQAVGAMAWIPATRRLRDGDVSRVRR